MNNYVKMNKVKAEPMTYGKYLSKIGLDVEDTPGNNENGFYVEYTDELDIVRDKWVDEEDFIKTYIFIDEDPLDFLCEYQISKAAKTGIWPKDVSISERSALAYRTELVENASRFNGQSTVDFGVAIYALEEGQAIRREGWNDKNIFVVKQVPGRIEHYDIKSIQSLPQSAKELILKSKGFISYESQCIIYNENTGSADSWVPSISDMLAKDWEIIEI